MTWERLSAENYRGRRVPVALGAALMGSAAVATGLVALLGHVGAVGLRVLLGCLLVFLAGLVDDLVPVGARGLRGHARALASGRMTTGILKLLVAGGVSVVLAVLIREAPTGVRAAGVVTMAGCANLWNGLDVRPGRALKAFLPLAVLLLFVDSRLVPVAPGLAVVAVLALPLDVRERAMLGDGGSNLLGFAAGIALYASLPGWAVVIAAAVVVVLNVLAETVTLSRMIESAPPLRWLDRLGRLSEEL